MKDLRFLKRQLILEIKKFNLRKEEVKKLKENSEYFDEIIRIFNFTEFQEIKDNLILLDINLQQVYNDESSKMLSIIHNLILNIENYSSIKHYYDEELKNELKKLEKIYNKIVNDKQLNNETMNSLNYEQKQYGPIIIEYKKILNSLKNNYIINSYQIKLIYEIMESTSYSEKEQILIMESIINHNKKIQSLDYEDEQVNLSKILNKNFDYIELEDYNLKSLNNKILSMYASLIFVEDLNEIYNYLPELETGLYTEEEYDYIYKSILNKIVREIKDTQEELSKKEIYHDNELYNLFIGNFLSMEKLFDCVKSIYLNSKIKTEIKELNKEEKKVANNIFFASNNSGESYLEKDIKDIPEESLEEVRKKIERFKYDELRKNEIKSFYSNNKLSSYRELRGDQIRIIFKNIKGNNYVFVGLFMKKDDKDQRSYINCANRHIDVDISTEEKYLQEYKKAEETYDRIINYIEENKRKGNRY